MDVDSLFLYALKGQGTPREVFVAEELRTGILGYTVKEG